MILEHPMRTKEIYIFCGHELCGLYYNTNSISDSIESIVGYMMDGELESP